MKKENVSSESAIDEEKIAESLEKIDTDITPEEFKDLPSKEKEDIKDQLIEATATFHSGPLPPPEQLIQYNEADPNAAKIIIDMAQKQSKHRQKIEEKHLNSLARDSLLGVLFAGIIGVIAICGGIFLVYTGNDWQGILFSGGTIGSLVGIYLKNTRMNNQDNESQIEDD